MINLSKYEEALITLNKAIAINHFHERAWNNKGAALKSLDRFEEALGAFNKALEINPNFQKEQRVYRPMKLPRGPAGDGKSLDIAFSL